MTQAINDIWAELAADLVLDQYADSTNLKALIKIFVDAGQSFENAINELKNFYNVSEAEGVKLDYIAKIRNLVRKDGESDEEFKRRILADSLIDNAGTPNFVIEQSALQSGDATPIYIEEQGRAPVVLVYTPNGRQLTRGFVNRITPAGVFGAPAAALVMDNEGGDIRLRKKLTFVNGKKILGIARRGYDDGIVKGYLLDEIGAHLTDDDGNRLTYEFKKW